MLATNTSSLSVTEISTANSRPGRVVGVHFFNPAPGAEPRRGRAAPWSPTRRCSTTSPALVEKLGKNPVVCGDKAGFIANTLLFGYLNHAASMFEGRYASREDIDAAMRFGCGYPMGPLALLDLIGLDTAYEILETMYRQGRDRLHAPTPILKQMVTAGLLGRKTGRGFYTYEGPDSPVVVADAAHAVGRRAAAAAPPHPQVGVVGTGTMASRHRRGLRQGRLRRAGRRPLAGQGRRRRRAPITKSFDKQIQRGRATEEAKTEVLARVTGTTSLDDLADVDLVVEAIAEDLAVKTTLFENLDEICKPGAILATTTSSLPIIAMATRHQPPAGRHRHALLQPGHDHEAGRGRLHGLDRRGRHRDHPRAVRQASARSRSPAPTGPASSSTRCCSPTSTTR